MKRHVTIAFLLSFCALACVGVTAPLLAEAQTEALPAAPWEVPVTALWNQTTLDGCATAPGAQSFSGLGCTMSCLAENNDCQESAQTCALLFEICMDLCENPPQFE